MTPYDGPPHDEPVVDDAATVDLGSDDDLFDESWQTPKRTNRLTAVLVVALLVVAGFVGGVLAQKHHDSVLVAAVAGAGARRTAGGPGREQPTSAPGTGGRGGDGEAEPPVVEGTIRTVDTDAIEVADPTGAVVRVFVPPIATVTTLGLGGLTFGTPVSVAGTKAVDGSVTATSVTVRRTGS